MKTMFKRVGFAVVCSWLIQGLFLSTGASNIIGFSALYFIRDTGFDERKVTNDAGALDLHMTTLTKCSSACSEREWCTSFFYTKSSGACSLHATVFVGPSFAGDSEGTRYYKHVVDWCSSDRLLYNRLAEMCVYFEQTTLATGWSQADAACVGMGMRLAHDLTPIQMDALLNFTKKNTDTFNQPIYIGLKRNPQQPTLMEWIDGEPLNTTAMAPYWEAYQPNGQYSGQDCVVIRAHVDSTLNDVTCLSHQFVCEKL